MFIVYNYICDTTQTRVLSYYTVDQAYSTRTSWTTCCLRQSVALDTLYFKKIILNFSSDKAGMEGIGSF
jgi:hypothetical protein